MVHDESELDIRVEFVLRASDHVDRVKSAVRFGCDGELLPVATCDQREHVLGSELVGDELGPVFSDLFALFDPVLCPIIDELVHAWAEGEGVAPLIALHEEWFEVCGPLVDSSFVCFFVAAG